MNHFAALGMIVISCTVISVLVTSWIVGAAENRIIKAIEQKGEENATPNPTPTTDTSDSGGKPNATNTQI